MTRWGKRLETIYDWVTVGLFAALIVLFLQRSSSDRPGDSLIHYLIAAVGLAVINQLGNSGYDLLAVIGLVGIVAFVQLTLKPLGAWKT
jgi:hypothetical protein